MSSIRKVFRYNHEVTILGDTSLLLSISPFLSNQRIRFPKHVKQWVHLDVSRTSVLISIVDGMIFLVLFGSNNLSVLYVFYGVLIGHLRIGSCTLSALYSAPNQS